MALLVVLLLTAACGGSAKKAAAPPRTAEPEIDFTVIDSPSLQFLPRHQEAQGWRLEEDPMVVPGDRLGTYLGADGEHFARYEVIDLTSGKYLANDNRGFATVEISTRRARRSATSPWSAKASPSTPAASRSNRPRRWRR